MLALCVCQVFQRRAAIHPCQQASQGVTHDSGFQSRFRRPFARRLFVILPEPMTRLKKSSALWPQVVRLAQEMSQSKPKVKGGITKMNDLLIEQYQPTLI